MIIKRPLTLIWSALLVILPNCGKVSDLLDKTSPSRSSKSVYVQDVSIQYKNLAPHTIGDAWQRQIKVLNKNKPVPNLVIGVRRYGERGFQLLGLTDAQGTITDTSVDLHTQYQFGQSLISDWQRARQDLVWTNEITSNEILKKYRALSLEKVIESNLSKPERELVVIQADRMVIAPNVIASWNQMAPLRILATSIAIDGILRAFSENCANGSNAPKLEINSDEMSGRGSIEWSGCRGTPGALGNAGKAGGSGHNQPFGQGKTGGPGGPGGNGGIGGRGGHIYIRSKVFDMSPQKILAEGGLGGVAGIGGPGGAGGNGAPYRKAAGVKFGPDVFATDSMGRAGKSGPQGKSGLGGPVGMPGEVRLSIDNKIYNISTN